MNYPDSLASLYRRSDPERGPGFWSGVDEVELGVERTRALLAAAGNPQDNYSCLHVAGSTGKGTTCFYLAAALKAAGIRVGLYTQPHLHSFRERLQIGFDPIAEPEFATQFARAIRFEDRARERCPEFGPATTFELSTVMALDWFARRRVDVAVIETGLGGRLDATNALSNKRAVAITPIGLEHTQILGTDLAAIAGEKAAIIRPGVGVASAAADPAAAAVIAMRCKREGAPLLTVSAELVNRIGQHFRARHLAQDAALALLTLKTGGFAIPHERAVMAMAKTELPARCEVFDGSPPMVVDGAHTGAAMAALAEMLREQFAGRRINLVFGQSRDKDPGTLLKAFHSPSCRLHLCRAHHPRAADPPALAAQLADFAAECHDSVEAALAAARADREGVVVVAGSMFVAAAARAQIAGIAGPPETIPVA